MDIFVISLGIGAGFVIISFFIGHWMELDAVGDGGMDLGDMSSDTGGLDGLESTETGAASLTDGDLNVSGWELLAAVRPVTIALFLTVFGATGIITRNFGAPFIASASIGAFLGLIFAHLLYKYVLLPLKRASNTSSSKRQELIGLAAKVTLKVSGNSYGKIVYTRKGNTYSSPAVTEENMVFNVGDIVEIKHIEDGKFYIGQRVVVPVGREPGEISERKLQ